MVDAPKKIWARPDPATVYMDGSSPLMARDREFRDAVEYIRADIAEAERDRLAAENEALKRMAFWFAKYPEFKPKPEMIDEVCADIELARPFIPSARAALDTAKGAGK